MLHLNLHRFPLFDPHTGDIFVDHTSNIKILDWSGGFSPDSGNCCLLPRAFHCGPAEREALVLKLGSKEAAQMVKGSVMAFYLGAVCAAAEANVPAAVMQQIALCQVHPAPAVSSMMWKMAVRSLTSQEIGVEDLAIQYHPVQLDLCMPSWKWAGRFYNVLLLCASRGVVFCGVLSGRAHLKPRLGQKAGQLVNMLSLHLAHGASNMTWLSMAEN